LVQFSGFGIMYLEKSGNPGVGKIRSRQENTNVRDYL
jgi:hypothetical protein